MFAQFLRLGFAGYTKIMKNMHQTSLYLAKQIQQIGAAMQLVLQTPHVVFHAQRDELLLLGGWQWGSCLWQLNRQLTTSCGLQRITSLLSATTKACPSSPSD